MQEHPMVNLSSIMSATGIKAFDSTLQSTHLWLDDLMRDLHWNGERQQAYHAWRAVLHALRDRLPVENAAHLAAQLPMLVRGIYYEGWVPSRTPVPEHTADEFVSHVSEAFQLEGNAVALDIAQAVLGVLCRHVSEGEIVKVKKVLPKGIRELWP
jgi:uncharacterized protein (DUF2267 family)